MMRSETKTFHYPNGEIQRVQLVQWEDWQQLEFLHPVPTTSAFERFCHIYRRFLVPGCPWVFGQMVLFRLPQTVALPECPVRPHGAITADKLTAAALILKTGLRIVCGKPVFLTDAAEQLWQQLNAQGCVQLVRGKLPFTKIIPVADTTGFLTECAEEAALKVNAGFFIMDSFDCATEFDQVGTPFGLCVKRGEVLSPPLYEREALLVRQDRSVRVETPRLEQLEVEIDGRRYIPGGNAVIYTRPQYKKTPADGMVKLVIVGRTVVAVKPGGSVPVPASGFVLGLKEGGAHCPGAAVRYYGMEDVLFGIQVGNSILKNGKKTGSFLSRFYNIRKLEPVPFPPSLYPMDFEKARAARIALGADAEGRPMLLWAEGAGKLRYVPGQDSCGASLAELGELCAAVGMYNAVNLDGGGSAQILLKNRRALRISDRNSADNSEAERPVPMGLLVR